MKIIVLSDVHGNVPALEAVLAELEHRAADMVVVNGDLVNRGPYSQQCLELMLRHQPAALLLRGNHESFTLQSHAQPLHSEDRWYGLHQFAQWTAEHLSDDALQHIAQWPGHLDREDLDGGSSFHITHGSVLGERDGISAKTPDEELRNKLGSHRELFVASHTHKAMLKEFQGRLVVNTGSVGQPLDGDARASFAEFTYQQGRWQAEQIRLAYDKQQAMEDFSRSGFLTEAGPMPLLIYCEHRLNRMLVGPMMQRYAQAIDTGEISLRQAVVEYLRDTGLEQALIEWRVDTSALR